MLFGLCTIKLELINFRQITIIRHYFSVIHINYSYSYLDSEMTVKIQLFQLSKSYYSSVIQIK